MKRKSGQKESPARSARLPLNAVRVFEAVAARRSFRAAAEALHVTTAAVSMQIKSLEDYLQVELFRRGARAVHLTAEGQSLLPYVRRGLDELEQGFRTVKSGRGGALVISLLASFLQKWLLGRLPAFQHAHPEIDLQLRTSMELVDFARDDAHVAIRYGRGGWPRVHAEQILEEWLVAVCTPALLKRYGPLPDVGGTGRYPLIHSTSEPWGIWLTGSDDGKEFWPPAATAFDDSVAALHAAQQGQGLALARWSLAAAAIDAGDLKLAHPRALPCAFGYYFVCPEPYLRLPKIAAFRAWLIEAAQRTAEPPR